MTTRVRATACRLKKTSLLSTGFTPLGYLRRNCSCVGVGRSWGVRGSLTAGQLGGAAGRAGLYLDGRHPEEADVEHAVGHEPHQVEDHKVEAQTHDTGGEGRGDKAGCGGAWRTQNSPRRAQSSVPLHAHPMSSDPLLLLGLSGGLLQRRSASHPGPSSAAPQRPTRLVGLVPEAWVFKIKVGQLSSPT